MFSGGFFQWTNRTTLSAILFSIRVIVTCIHPTSAKELYRIPEHLTVNTMTSGNPIRSLFVWQSLEKKSKTTDSIKRIGDSNLSSFSQHCPFSYFIYRCSSLNGSEEISTEETSTISHALPWEFRDSVWIRGSSSDLPKVKLDDISTIQAVSSALKRELFFSSEAFQLSWFCGGTTVSDFRMKSILSRIDCELPVDFFDYIQSDFIGEINRKG